RLDVVAALLLRLFLGVGRLRAARAVAAVLAAAVLAASLVVPVEEADDAVLGPQPVRDRDRHRAGEHVDVLALDGAAGVLGDERSLALVDVDLELAAHLDDARVDGD